MDFVCHAGLELDDTLSGRETLPQYLTNVYFDIPPRETDELSDPIVQVITVTAYLPSRDETP